MSIISRRRFTVSAAAAAAAFGLDGRMEFLASAHAQGAGTPMNPKGLPFFRFKVGDIEITQVYDGETTRPLDANFIPGVGVEDIQKALSAGGLPSSVIPANFTITIARIGGRYVMFDAGNGPMAAAPVGALHKNMEAAGIKPSDIATIVMTHFHPDHFFGLMDKDNAQLYPNAEIVMPEAEYSYWTDPGVIAKLPQGRVGMAQRIQATFPNWKNVRRAASGSEVLPGVRSVASYGHTPGHTSYLVASGGQQLMVLADVTNIPQLFVRNPGWRVMFDQDPAMAEDNRRRMFDRVVADNIPVAGYHYGMPGAGRIAKDGAGYVFSPMG